MERLPIDDVTEHCVTRFEEANGPLSTESLEEEGVRRIDARSVSGVMSKPCHDDTQQGLFTIYLNTVTYLYLAAALAPTTGMGIATGLQTVPQMIDMPKVAVDWVNGLSETAIILSGASGHGAHGAATMAAALITLAATHLPCLAGGVAAAAYKKVASR